MQKQLISVIIPVYNGANYLNEIISALKEQTYKCFEAIFVDDGSTDNTLAIFLEKIGNDSRFSIYTKNNEGASSARNYGTKVAKGEYIAFIDVDDYIFPEYLEYLYELLLNYNCDMSCCSYYKMWNNEEIPHFKEKEEVITFLRDEAIIDYLYRKHITGYPCLKLYKADIVKKILFPTSIIYGEDGLFTFEALKKCNKVVYGNKTLYIYYQHMSSASHKSKIDYLQYELSWKSHKECILHYAEKNERVFLNAAKAKCFILAIDYCCRIWKYKEAFSFRKELLSYISLVDSDILGDRNSKRLNRLLAMLSCINTKGMIRLCRLYNLLKRKLHFETRKSV